MKLLITPAEVSARCFGGDENITAGFITESVILSAQRRFVSPVLGGSLWAVLESGKYAAFTGSYVKPAVAMYVKYLILPALAAQSGLLGVVRHSGHNFHEAGEEPAGRLRRSVRSEADTLLKICYEHVESEPDSYPEYDSRENIRYRSVAEGGIVL